MESFIYTSHTQRILFGAGTISSLLSELHRLGVSKPLLLTGPRGASTGQAISSLLSDQHLSSSSHSPMISAGHFSQATPHTPLAVTSSALSLCSSSSADLLLSVGGGGAIGLGKALAARTGLPQIAVPTTYAGSECTSVLGETGEDGRKVLRREEKLRLEVVVYDVDLTTDLGVEASMGSGGNAMAHAVEALYAPNTNPIIKLMAAEGIKALGEALPEIPIDPHSASARSKILYAAWLCSTCVGSTGPGLHHKLAHVLGGVFNLPHAETHTILLPHSLAYNAPAIPETLAVISESLPDAKKILKSGSGRRSTPPRACQRDRDLRLTIPLAPSGGKVA